MKLIDIINNIDKTTKNEDYIDVTKFNYELNYDFDYIKQEKLKCYWIGNWCCTDSWVGYRIYFLNDKPVAVSSQLGRKCDESFEWLSYELAIEVKEYLISIMQQKEDKLKIKLCDINEEVGDGFKIQFNNQIINKDKAILNGENIKILERIKETPDLGIDQKLKIQLINGEIKDINIIELDFKYNLDYNNLNKNRSDTL